MFRIMIVEDDPGIVRELDVLLRSAMYDTCHVIDFEQPLQEIEKYRPDLVLLDMNLPKMDGLTICTKLRESSEVPIIFVTSNQTSMDELNCLMRGGDDYIAKPYQAPILLAHIAAVLKRCKKIEPKEEVNICYRDVTLNIATATLSKAGRTVELSKNELKIMHYLFGHPGVIVPRVEIVEYLWDQQMFIDDNTLSVNITRIRSKLDEIGAKEFIETKRGLGYKI